MRATFASVRGRDEFSPRGYEGLDSSNASASKPDVMPADRQPSNSPASNSARKLKQLLRPLTNPVRSRFIAWLDRHLAAYRRTQTLPRIATIEPTAAIYPECMIENPGGDPANIQIGHRSALRCRLVTFAHGGKIEIGDACYVGHRTEIWSMDSVRIGKRVLISHDVNINDSTCHSRNADERARHFEQIMTTGHPKDPADLPGILTAPIIIEDDVWIGFGATILRGVRIGARSIIAARAIVTKDVPADVIYYNEVRPIIRPLNPNSFRS